MQKSVALMLVALLMIVSGCNLQRPAPKPETARVAAGVTIEGVQIGELTEDEFDGLLKRMADEKYQSPQNAVFDSETGRIIPERQGRRMNVVATKVQGMSAPANSHLFAVYQHVMPELTVAKLEKAEKIGAYTSPIINDEAGRLQNIRLTAKLINNAIIEPGHEFSFNHITGEPSAERGFEKAAVFGEDGSVRYELGGGMCQVSSTLYNAVLSAKLPVTERHPHSRPVDYVPANCDATTYTDKDFKFINDTRHTLIIRSFVTGRKLTVDLWSLPL